MKNPYCDTLEYKDGNHIVNQAKTNRTNGGASVKFPSQNTYKPYFSDRINHLIDTGVVKCMTWVQYQASKPSHSPSSVADFVHDNHTTRK